MDFVSIVFYILLLAVVVSPFLYVGIYEQKSGLLPVTKSIPSAELEDLLGKRENALANLNDVKIEFETGKLTQSEFNDTSDKIVLELEDFDRQIEQIKEKVKKSEMPGKTGAAGIKYCHECGFKIEIVQAKFCPQCGTKLIL